MRIYAGVRLGWLTDFVIRAAVLGRVRMAPPQGERCRTRTVTAALSSGLIPDLLLPRWIVQWGSPTS